MAARPCAYYIVRDVLGLILFTLEFALPNLVCANLPVGSKYVRVATDLVLIVAIATIIGTCGLVKGNYEADDCTWVVWAISDGAWNADIYSNFGAEGEGH